MNRYAIVDVKGRQVWDSRERSTVEAEVTLAGGALGRAIAPAGASRGMHEAVDLRDGTANFGTWSRLGGSDVNDEIAASLKGREGADQEYRRHADCTGRNRQQVAPRRQRHGRRVDGGHGVAEARLVDGSGPVQISVPSSICLVGAVATFEGGRNSMIHMRYRRVDS